MADASLVALGPAAHVALLGLAVALGPLGWVWARHRGADPARRLRALGLLTLFLTFDLVLFGAFTRLTDSGLGCPDWPGCYGHASPAGAQAPIAAEQAARPTGPVTHTKAWIEMLHRYLATAVGVLITTLAALTWMNRRHGPPGAAPGWALATLVWVCVQGAFGALTVTLKLYPAIVTLHLLGGIGLLALLAIQWSAWPAEPLQLAPRLRVAVWAVTGLSVLQVALGAWVSSNYAVLACTEFPTCQGTWWPEMDFEHGFTLRRSLGATAGGESLPFAALTAIHVVHRAGAALVFAAVLLLAWRLHAGASRSQRQAAGALVLLVLWQFVTGVSNAVLGWPMAAALAHTGGAAVLIGLLCLLVARSVGSKVPAQTGAMQAPGPMRAAS